MFSQLNTTHLPHPNTPRMQNPLRSPSPVVLLPSDSDPLHRKQSDLHRSQSAENKSRSPGRRQLPFIPGNTKLPSIIRISKAQLQQVNQYIILFAVFSAVVESFKSYSSIVLISLNSTNPKFSNLKMYYFINILGMCLLRDRCLCLGGYSQV